MSVVIVVAFDVYINYCVCIYVGVYIDVCAGALLRIWPNVVCDFVVDFTFGFCVYVGRCFVFCVTVDVGVGSDIDASLCTDTNANTTSSYEVDAVATT